MTVTVGGIKYQAKKRTNERCDGYLVKGIIETNVKHPEKYKHVINIDGQSICVKVFNQGVFYIFTATLAFIMLVLLAVFTPYKKQDDKVSIDKGDTQVSINNNPSPVSKEILLRYNKYLLYQFGTLDIRFINSNHKATIHIDGENITMDKVEVEPDQEIATIAAQITSDEEIINANLVYEYDGKTLTYPVVIENLDKDNQIDTEADVSFETEEVIYE